MSKKREIPIRKCVATGKRLPKNELLRIVCIEGTAVIDPTGIQSGRGAYITADLDAIKKAKRKNAFAKALRTKVDEEIYELLLERVGDQDG